jgi:crotonobetainyl-CoA:carnitine CoA-transferase CaiB-like acyl-CoA transferase
MTQQDPRTGDAPHAPTPDPGAPLHGIRVLDLSTVLFGPLASRWLSDYGADVIKVESPAGDSTRTTGVQREPGLAGGFMGTNRGKRSIVLDLKHADGRAALRKLLEDADVLMHNIRPQKLAAIGLDLSELRIRYPRLVVACLNGFSEQGPYGGRPAYDDIVQGMCGLADLMHRQTGEVQYLPTVAADKVSGLIASQAILTALLARNRTGQGQQVEIPMFECMADFTLMEHRGPHMYVPPLGTLGYARVLARARRPYRTLDGYVCMMPYTTAQWGRFFGEVGRPDLAADPRFQDMASRTKHIDILLPLLAEGVASRTTGEWLAVCDRLDIPAGPVNTLEQLFEDPHLRAVGFFQTVENADNVGAALLSSPGVRFNGALPKLRPASRLGQDTRQVLREAGLSEDEIAALLASRAAQAFSPKPA